MWLESIDVERLRNLSGVSLRLPSGLTVLSGRNGQGKTSLLEAIYLLGTTKSFRTRKLGEVVSWDGGPARVAGEVHSRLGRTRLSVAIDGAARSAWVEGAERPVDDYLGRLDLVDLTGDRVQVLRGPPEERRRFMDRGVVGLAPSTLRLIGEYRRTLSQRNALLRALGPDPARSRLPELDAWDERLARAAVGVHAARRRYLSRLGASLGSATRIVFFEGEELIARYAPSPASAARMEVDHYAAALSEALRATRRRDVGLGFTGVGPHRDDMVVELDGVDLRRFGSAGQVRSSLIVLKIGKLEVLRADRGEAPVFLMDDFDTDVDDTRAGAVARHLHEVGFQAIVATSKQNLLERLEVPFHHVLVDSGRARSA